MHLSMHNLEGRGEAPLGADAPGGEVSKVGVPGETLFGRQGNKKLPRCLFKQVVEVAALLMRA
jgi:hypothetical protein